ncbi:MAG TPA: aminotransferase class V-fold PLP-dependent enzyme [Fastidiosipila sp.]|nr:aminotransferase class V-fold PLP-dependent enzyme [Fastidiosipila sp.]
MIYLDHAATSLPKPPEVLQAVETALQTYGGAGRGVHEAAMNANRNVFAARAAVASLFGFSPERVAFTANATHSLNLAISGLLGPGDHVISTALEHNSVLRPLYRLQQEGMELSIVPADQNGSLDYEQFERFLQPNTKAVVCTHASNVTGGILDLSFISTFCKTHDLLLIVDAAQTAGILPIDATLDGIDVLCFTGHKGLFGPQGTGGLCIRKGLDISPLIVGGSGTDSYAKTQPEDLPEALEAGTRNGPGIAGLLAGIQFIQRVGIENIKEKTDALRSAFIEGISSLPDIKIYGDQADPHVSIVALNIADIDASFVSHVLADEFGICTRPGAHCAPLAHEALGTKSQGVVRFSFGLTITEADVEAAIEAVHSIAKDH